MSIVEPTLFSLARAAVVAAATLALLLVAGPGVRAMPRSLRSWFFWAAMATLLAPGFVSAWLFFENASKQGAYGRELLYCLLIWVRYPLLAVLTVWLMPPSLSSEAMLCFQQSTRASWWRRRWWELRAWGRGLWIGIALVFLLAFQEFEFATTWNMRSWTVALFDAQAGGLALGESLRLALLPCAIQLALIAILVSSIRPAYSSPQDPGFVGQRAYTIFTPALLGMAVYCAPPLVMAYFGPYSIYRRGLEAFDLAPWREVWNGIGIAIAATIFTWLISGWISARRGLRWLLVLPGLFGPLLCGLLILAGMQLPLLHRLRDTLVPPIFGLALVLLPFALLLRFGIETTRDKAALHIARAAGARRAIWLLEGFPVLCALLLLFCFGYGDFTINSLLAPPAFTSASVRLLNLLHYGQSAALAVMFVLSFAVPITAVLLTAALARLYARRRVC
jgi:hypothetical protein